MQEQIMWGWGGVEVRWVDVINLWKILFLNIDDEYYVFVWLSYEEVESLSPGTHSLVPCIFHFSEFFYFLQDVLCCHLQPIPTHIHVGVPSVQRQHFLDLIPV